MSKRNRRRSGQGHKSGGNTRQKKKLNSLMAMADAIVKVFQKHPTKGLNYKQVAKEIGCKNKIQQQQVLAVIEDLVDQEVLEESSRGKYKFIFKEDLIIGTIDATSSGSGYLVVSEEEDDYYIHSKNMGQALHGDRVEAKVVRGRKKPEAIVANILERAKTEFIGTVELNTKFAFIVPDNQKIKVDFYVPLTKLKGAQDGQKVVVKMSDWPKNSKNPFGHIVEVLGDADDNDVVMHSILFEYDLPAKFPAHVEADAANIPMELDPAEIAKRRDFRNITTFTIDPKDAKDFDDALSVQKLPNGNWEIGVHIADVSHYVRPGTDLDNEAYDRATSVYLVDRVVPMLPEKLSNGVCSLRPHEEKYCFSAVFEINDDGKIKNEWFGRTAIYSDRRFTYEEAQEIIEGADGDFRDEILTLDGIAKKLRKKRLSKGAITFDRVEVKFDIDETGKPLGVYFKESKDANKLIEEFMLLANKRVAMHIGAVPKGKKAKTFVYRIHDKPSPEKFDQFANFAVQFGHYLKGGDGNQISRSINQLLKDVEGKKEGNMLQTLAIRTMAKAEYSTNNIGHYGLAFEYYSHFTSPIRRYPDVMVHRLLQEYLDGGPSASEAEYEEKCAHSSKREKLAADAERDSIKYKQVEFMQDRLGQEFPAVVTGVTEWGIYAEVEETMCEGMISLKTMSDDTYIFDQDNFCVYGKNYGEKYTLGDRILIEVKNADLSKKQLDYLLAGRLDD